MNKHRKKSRSVVRYTSLGPFPIINIWELSQVQGDAMHSCCEDCSGRFDRKLPLTLTQLVILLSHVS